MTGHIYIYGFIGTGKGEISLKNVISQVDDLADNYEVHIFSYGGDVYEGFAIYNFLSQKLTKPKVAKIESVCASIATLVAGACDTIVMSEKSQFMIHNPKITELASPSDARNLRNIADQLDQIKTLLIDVYEKKTGLPTNKLWELYDKETWLTPQQCLEMGFADEVETALKAVAKINLNSLPMEKKHENLFQRLINAFRANPPKNEMRETLEDGRIIIVLTEDGDWTGKQVIQENGEALEAGTYKLTSGKTFTVGPDSTITEVQEATPPENKEVTPPNEEEMEKDKKIAELEAQLTALKAEKETADAATAEAKANAAKIENRVKSMESDFLKMKEEMTKTFGDTTSPGKGPVNKFSAPKIEDYDPMGEEALKILKAQNRI